MADGNQVCKPIWADLPIEPINRKKQATVKISKSVFNSENVFNIK